MKITRKELVRSLLLSFLLIITFSCHSQGTSESDMTKVAFMADVHLQDVYGDFEDTDYKGILNPNNGEYVVARTMQSQLHSTRIFNENYFAFLAALDDVVARGVKYVILPGDFSDDGQPVNVRGLKEILNEYSETYGIRFLATTGNHDPVRPFAMAAGKKDFLGEGGKPQIIISETGLYSSNDPDNPVVVTKDIQKWGYEGIVTTLSDFGFFPQEEDVYWESPFSTYDYENYSFAIAEEQSQFSSRNYLIPPYNTSMPDVSYLVEPEEGVWFLAIDANVYIPKSNAQSDPSNPSNYESTSVGYDNVLTHKQHLIDWVNSVCLRAEKYGKTLIVFSHYPMVEFNNDASVYITALLGEGTMQTHRVPGEDVAKSFANAGVKLHFAGHMHINDTGVRTTEEGNTLINVQIPSLAAYIPAYKLATVQAGGMVEIETIVIDSVPRFDELFPIYETEHEYLSSINSSDIWNKQVLTATSYHEFTRWHMRELLRLRFLEDDWPVDFRDFLLQSSGRDLLIYAKVSEGMSEDQLKAYDDWTGFDMIYDFYLLRSADKLALGDIGQERILQYQTLIAAFLANMKAGQDTYADEFLNFAKIFNLFLDGNPADHFLIDLNKGEITELQYTTAIDFPSGRNTAEFTVYPNPTKADATVNIQSNRCNSPVSMFDLEGHLVFCGVLDNAGCLQVDIDKMQAGIYVLKVGVNLEKLVVL